MTTIEPGSEEWIQMNEAIDATIETIRKGILDITFSPVETSLARTCLQELWEAAFEAGQTSMY